MIIWLLGFIIPMVSPMLWLICIGFAVIGIISKLLGA